MALLLTVPFPRPPPTREEGVTGPFYRWVYRGSEPCWGDFMDSQLVGHRAGWGDPGFLAPGPVLLPWQRVTLLSPTGPAVTGSLEAGRPGWLSALQREGRRRRQRQRQWTEEQPSRSDPRTGKGHAGGSKGRGWSASGDGSASGGGRAAQTKGGKILILVYIITDSSVGGDLD